MRRRSVPVPPKHPISPQWSCNRIIGESLPPRIPNFPATYGGWPPAPHMPSHYPSKTDASSPYWENTPVLHRRRFACRCGKSLEFKRLRARRERGGLLRTDESTSSLRASRGKADPARGGKKLREKQGEVGKMSLRQPAPAYGQLFHVEHRREFPRRRQRGGGKCPMPWLTRTCGGSGHGTSRCE